MSTLRTALALVVLGSAGLGVQSVVAQTEWGLIAPGYENARQRYRQVPDHAAKTAGILGLAALPQLQEVSLAEGYLELRVWVVRSTVPHQMLRLIKAETQVVGEMFAWWSVPGSIPIDRNPEDLSGRYGCHVTKAMSGARVDRLQGDIVENGVCRVDFSSAEPSWDELLRGLESARVVELPDQSTLPFSFDGTRLWVDVLEGRRFRSYEYYDPGGRSTKNSQDARRILDLVDSAFPPTR